MWSAAGQRVSTQKIFHETSSKEIQALYRRHARGNSLYRNKGNGQFENIGQQAGVEMGRWSWCSDFWDFDHDGYPDLYIANGYISALDRSDLASFFWRQVVGKSPDDATPALAYERGWQALNELIRSDSSWSGYERNVMYANNRDGTFAEVSGVRGDGFSGRRTLLRSRRSRSRRTAGSRTEESKRAATADFAQCDAGDWPLDFLSPARKEEQSRRHWSSDHRRVGSAAPDQISAGWIWIPRPTFQGNILRAWKAGSTGSGHHSLAERALSGVDGAARESSHRSGRGLGRICGQTFQCASSCICAGGTTAAARAVAHSCGHMADRTVAGARVFPAGSRRQTNESFGSSAATLCCSTSG